MPFLRTYLGLIIAFCCVGMCLSTLKCTEDPILLKQGEERLTRLIVGTTSTHTASDWDITKMTDQDIIDFVCSRKLVSASVDCLKSDFLETEQILGLCSFVGMLCYF